jgi:uncharacterized protein YjbJ (UPF0337 family)
MPTEWHKIMGKWKQFSGSIKQHWGNLTHDEGMKIKGKREVLAGTIEERFGVTKLKANKQNNTRADSLKPNRFPLKRKF